MLDCITYNNKAALELWEEVLCDFKADFWGVTGIVIERSSGLQFEQPGAVLELVGGVKIGCVNGAILPHAEDDFQPALAETTQRGGVTLTAFAQSAVIDLGPRINSRLNLTH